MADRTLAAPLAFALALSAPGWDALQSKDASELLVPGSLGQLFSRGEKAMLGDGFTSEPGGADVKSQIAQWFNVNPCFMGYWRRC
jgi:hypothetical protein